MCIKRKKSKAAVAAIYIFQVLHYIHIYIDNFTIFYFENIKNQSCVRRYMYSILIGKNVLINNEEKECSSVFSFSFHSNKSKQIKVSNNQIE